MSVEDKNINSAVTKVFYFIIAQKYGSTSRLVERAIQSAIKVAWDKGNLSILQRYFSCKPNQVEGKPTNSKFIAMIAEWLQLQGRQCELIA